MVLGMAMGMVDTAMDRIPGGHMTRQGMNTMLHGAKNRAWYWSGRHR